MRVSLDKGATGTVAFLFVLAALIVACYWQVGELGFVWDDQAFLVEQQGVRAAHSLYELMFKPFFISADYYRPLVVLSYAVQYQMVGLAAADFHWGNVIIHCANSIILALVALKIARLQGVSIVWGMLVALFYAISPAMVEAVAWVSGRFDLMMTSFVLLALYCDVSLEEGWLKAFLVGCFFLMAALCKETAIGFALCYPFWRLWLRSLKGEETGLNFFCSAWKTYLGIFIAGVIYLLLRIASMGYLVSGSVYNDYGSGFQRLLLSAKAFTTYVWVAIFPYGKISPFHYQAFPVPANDFIGLVSLAVIAVLLAFLVLAWRFERRYYVFAVLTFFLSILAALHLFQTPLQDNLIQERYLQFPLALLLVMLFISIGRVWEASLAFKITSSAVVCIALAASCANILVTVPLWKDSLTLWTWATKSSPESSAVWSNMAAAYQERGQYDEAVKSAQYALQLGGRKTTLAAALITLGNVENVRGNLDKAAEYYLQSFEESRELPGALINMLSVLIRMKEYDSAKWYIDTASSFSRALEEPYFFFNCGLYYLSRGDRGRAKEYFDKAISMVDESRRAGISKAAQDYLSGERKISYWDKAADG